MKYPFDIYELSPELNLKVYNEPAPPHRHEFEELLIITRGRVVHFIDFNREELEGPVVIYVAEGKVHQFIPEADVTGWVIKYRSDFLPDSKFHFYSYFSDSINFTLNTSFCINGLESLCRLMQAEVGQEKPAFATIQHLLAAILSKLENEGGNRFIDPAEARNNNVAVFYSFLLLLKDNYMRPEGVGFYAEKLNTSVRNLNHICRNVFGKSVSEIIETRKLIEARQMLLNTGKTVSEVGYELGYNEKSYFTKVFKTKTGLTPTLFRQQMGLMIS